MSEIDKKPQESDEKDQDPKVSVEQKDIPNKDKGQQSAFRGQRKPDSRRRQDSQHDGENAFIEKILFINRTTKVTKGGKNLGFSALVVVGDGKEKAGFALGKANEVADAIRKGLNKAKRAVQPIKKKGDTIAHQTIGKFGAVEILLKPASKGTGVIACSPVRAVCECAGIKDILTKNIGNSTNPINVVKAAFAGLMSLKA